MRKTILMASVLAFSVSAFAQKKEIKEIVKAIDKGQLAQAQNLLANSKDLILSSEKYASEYYFWEGTLYLEKAKKGQDVINSLSKVAEAFSQAEKMGSKQGSELLKRKEEAVNLAIVKGQEAYNAEDFKKATPSFEVAYRLSPKDTIFLYNAAVLAVQAKDFDTALKHYIELKDLKYDGSETIYKAKNKETGKEEEYRSEAERDLLVKNAKTHINPTKEKTPSKKAEIIKNIALIYVEQGKKEEALKAFEEARKAYPKDASLVIQEAYIYLQLENKNKFKELMQEATLLEPNNADIQYNIGVINIQQGNDEEARKAFEKALSIKPDFADAILNISTIYINQGNALVETMNNLGNTKADIKKYNDLKEKKDEYFKKAASVLEEYIKNQGKNTDILEQLKNIYGALGDNANFKRIKDML